MTELDRTSRLDPGANPAGASRADCNGLVVPAQASVDSHQPGRLCPGPAGCRPGSGNGALRSRCAEAAGPSASPPMGFAGANATNFLGTDQLGRDLLSRTLYGLQLTMAIALIGSCISLVLGTTLVSSPAMPAAGSAALIMAVVDIQIAIPFTLIALVVIAVFGNSLPVLDRHHRLWPVGRSMPASCAPRSWLRPACPSSKQRSPPAPNIDRILLKHILPNIVSPIIVVWTMTFSALILLGILTLLPRARGAAADGNAGLHGRAGTRLSRLHALDRPRAGPRHHVRLAAGPADRRLAARRARCQSQIDPGATAPAQFTPSSDVCPTPNPFGGRALCQKET